MTHTINLTLPGSGLFNQYNTICHSVCSEKVWRTWKRIRGLQVLLWLLNFSDLNLIKHLWDSLEKSDPGMHNLQLELKGYVADMILCFRHFQTLYSVHTSTGQS